MTIYAALLRWPVRLETQRERWDLSDGDFVDVDRMRGADDNAPLVIVCHGLEGSSRAGYVRGTLAALKAQGLAAVALNFRNCSDEPNRLARSYHSGETGDLAEVIERIRKERPGRVLGLCGFSLGGNVSVKYLGERRENVPPELRAAVVISVPFDLSGCCLALDGPGVAAFIYRERFLRRLRGKAIAKSKKHPIIDGVAARTVRTIREFDEVVTAPLHGFAGAEDYYRKSSAAAFVDGVRRPLLVIQAEDDPFVPLENVPVTALRANPNITLELSRHGGHVGFLAGKPWWPERHAELRAAAFLSQKLRSV